MIVDENREAFMQEDIRDPSLVADRSSYVGPMEPKKLLHDGRAILLQGPTFWKWKRPNFPMRKNLFNHGNMRNNIFYTEAIKNAATKRTGPKHFPLDFSAEVDLTKLLKKKTKITLLRDTLIKWSSDKITMPFEIFDGDIDSYNTELDISKYARLVMQKFQEHNKIFFPDFLLFQKLIFLIPCPWFLFKKSITRNRDPKTNSSMMKCSLSKMKL
jgi:hypothetical protein